MDAGAEASSSGTYMCANCHGVFDPVVSDEDCDAEYARNFPDAAACGEPREIVCDDCYRLMCPQFYDTALLPPEAT